MICPISSSVIYRIVNQLMLAVSAARRLVRGKHKLDRTIYIPRHDDEFQQCNGKHVQRSQNDEQRNLRPLDNFVIYEIGQSYATIEPGSGIFAVEEVVNWSVLPHLARVLVDPSPNCRMAG